MNDQGLPSTVWTGNLDFETEFPPGERITLTSVPAAERPGAGPSPMEAVQAALSACTGIDVLLILQKMRKEPRSLRIDVDATRRDEQPRIYTHLRLIYHIDGETLDAAAARRAVSLSQDKYCSVAAMLRPTVELSYEIVLNGEVVEAE